ncbi:MAG: class I SAM-dependent methyltransferase [archaeon]
MSSDWVVKNVRPEDVYKNASDFYSKEEVKRYANSGTMRKMQSEMTLTALEIAEFKECSKVLDIGCGTGMSLKVLKEKGFKLTGIDVSTEMIKEARKNFENVFMSDMQDLPFKKNSFHGIISISALQWSLSQKPLKEIEITMKKIGKEFYRVLKKHGKAVIQFYPQSKQVLSLVINEFEKSSFNVEVFLSKPESKRKRKYFLLLEKN